MEYTFVPSEPQGGQSPYQPPSDASTSTNNLKWSIYTQETASRSHTAPLKQRTIASDVPLDKLKVSPEQLQHLQELYRASPTMADDGTAPVDYLYKVTDDDQLAASAIMAQQGLDIDARERLDNRWSQQWSRNSAKSAKAVSNTRRILYLWWVVVQFYLYRSKLIHNCVAVGADMIMLGIRLKSDTPLSPLRLASPTRRLHTLSRPTKSCEFEGISTTTLRAKRQSSPESRPFLSILPFLSSHFLSFAMGPHSPTLKRRTASS